MKSSSTSARATTFDGGFSSWRIDRCTPSSERPRSKDAAHELLPEAVVANQYGAEVGNSSNGYPTWYPHRYKTIRTKMPQTHLQCGCRRNGSDGTRTRDLRRDRPAL